VVKANRKGAAAALARLKDATWRASAEHHLIARVNVFIKSLSVIYTTAIPTFPRDRPGDRQGIWVQMGSKC